MQEKICFTFVSEAEKSGFIYILIATWNQPASDYPCFLFLILPEPAYALSPVL